MNSNLSYGPETAKWGHDPVTLTFDLWPWPFAWTLLLSLVITPENFMMIRWWEHCQKGVTDGQTEIAILKAAWSQLKIKHYLSDDVSLKTVNLILNTWIVLKITKDIFTFWIISRLWLIQVDEINTGTSIHVVSLTQPMIPCLLMLWWH